MPFGSCALARRVLTPVHVHVNVPVPVPDLSLARPDASYRTRISRSFA
jgi:hypothetical protein